MTDSFWFKHHSYRPQWHPKIVGWATLSQWFPANIPTMSGSHGNVDSIAGVFDKFSPFYIFYGSYFIALVFISLYYPYMIHILSKGTSVIQPLLQKLWLRWLHPISSTGRWNLHHSLKLGFTKNDRGIGCKRWALIDYLQIHSWTWFNTSSSP